MKYNELIEDKGIFNYLNELKPLPFNDVVTPDQIDFAFTFTSGNMVLSQSTVSMFIKYGADETLKRTAGVLYALFSKKWGQLYNAFIDELPLNSSQRETLKDNNTLIESVDHNVSAYDSDDLVKDNQDSTNNTTNHSYTKDTISMNALESNINILQDNYIYDIIFNDIRSVIISLIQ